MKTNRTLFAAFLSLVSVFAASAQIEWLETRHNFGAFAEEVGPVECRFHFVNTSGEPVSIVSARASCGCATPRFSRGTVAPGDTSYITVTYDPAGRPGHFTKTVGVDFSVDVPRTKLYIEGTVIGSESSIAARFPVKCCPAIRLSRGVVLLGELKKGQLRPVYLDAYNMSADTITPVVRDMPSYLEAAVSPEQVPPGQQFTFIFYMHSARCPLYGAVSDTVSVVSDSRSSEGCTVPVVAMVREDFSKMTPGERKKAPVAAVSSTQIDFGRLSSGVCSQTVAVTNNGKSPLKIRRVYTTDPGVEVSVSGETVRHGKNVEIKVTVDPAKLPGKMLNARINLITNDPDNPVIVLRAVGEL